MPRLAWLLAVLAATACYRNNPESAECAANPNQPGCNGSGQTACMASTDCKDQLKPACDTVDGQCYACTVKEPKLCLGTDTPHCDVHTCVGCFDDSDCNAGGSTAYGTGICLPSGACAGVAGSTWLRTTPTGSPTADCVSAPCSLSHALDLARSAATPTFIRLEVAGMYTPSSGAGFVIDTPPDKPVTIDARGAMLHANGDAPVVTVNPGKAGTLLGGTYENGAGGNADGLSCEGTGAMPSKLAVHGATIRNNDQVGVSAVSCALTLARSIITGNKKGGVSVTSGSFVIVGNAIYANPGGPNPPVLINNSAAPPLARFEFNTVVGNTVDAAVTTAGVNCTAGSGFVARYNIIWGNKDKSGNDIAQTASTCPHEHSDIGPTAYSGIGTKAGLVSIAPGIAGGDWRLGNATLTISGATPDVTGLAERDLDFQRRVAPINLGADQLVAP